MGPGQKREVIDLVRRSPVAKKHTLAELGSACSTYYRWQRRYQEQGEVGLVDRRPPAAELRGTRHRTITSKLTCREDRHRFLRCVMRQESATCGFTAAGTDDIDLMNEIIQGG